MNDDICCPKCGSKQIHADKKGFGTGKAIAGTLIGGVVIGGLAGTVGSNKIRLTCLNCGHVFMPGEQAKGIQIPVKDYSDSNVKFVGSEEYKLYKCTNCEKVSSIGSKLYCPKCGNKVSEKDIYFHEATKGLTSTVIVVVIVIVVILFILLVLI